MPRRLLALLLLPLLLGEGCILGTIPTFIHDKILGPVSPAGSTRAYASQAGFQVTDQGVTVYESGHLYRPYPVDMMSRGLPSRMHWNILKGGQAFIAGFSPVVMRDTKRGERLDDAKIEGLRPGATALEVLDILGPPQMWIRRKTGSIMGYRADLSHSLTFYLGTPPFLSSLVPVPGINSLNFRYTAKWDKPYKTLMFFDADDHLLAVTTNEDSGDPGEETEE